MRVDIIWDFGRRIIAMRSKCFFFFSPLILKTALQLMKQFPLLDSFLAEWNETCIRPARPGHHIHAPDDHF